MGNKQSEQNEGIGKSMIMNWTQHSEGAMAVGFQQGVMHTPKFSTDNDVMMPMSESEHMLHDTGVGTGTTMAMSKVASHARSESSGHESLRTADWILHNSSNVKVEAQPAEGLTDHIKENGRNFTT